jgi:ABC-type nitrate/sulfonate/bicarbonate transport system ATPase subunit
MTENAPALAFGRVSCTFVSRDDPGQRYTAVRDVTLAGGAGESSRSHPLSGGMRKRVSLAQTLVLDPDIILMDEPFSALDVQTRQLMENEVLALWAARKKCSSSRTTRRGDSHERSRGRALRRTGLASDR